MKVKLTTFLLLAFLCTNHTMCTEVQKIIEVPALTDKSAEQQSIQCIQGLYDDIIKYYTEQAEAGNTTAMVALGDIYLMECGNCEYTAQNVQKGLELLEKAVAAGDTGAMMYLGYLYFYGKVRDKDINIEKNPEKAIGLFQKAADNGEIRAYAALANMYERGVEGLIKSDYPTALKYYKKGALLGDEYCISEYKDRIRSKYVMH